MPPGTQPEAVESDERRVGMKVDISRSKFEVYNFATRYNSSEAAIDELLQMLSSVGNIEPASDGCLEKSLRRRDRARMCQLDHFHFRQHLTLL